MLLDFFRQAIKPPTGKYSRRSASCFNSHQESQNVGTDSPIVKSEENQKKNKELQRLAFFGAGPKLPGKSLKFILLLMYDTSGIIYQLILL